jgi:protein disulfide-isomerase A6
VCVLAFLPHILDSKAKGREAHLAMLKRVSTANKALPIAYMWAEGYSQQKLEESFHVGGAGYPALVAVNVAKKRYVNFAGAFDSANINAFLTRMTSGKESTIPVAAIGKVVEVEEWDGKDGVMPE